MPITPANKKKLAALGERVKKVRNEKGLTLKELAHAIGKDPQSVHRLEVGGINPSFLYLEELSAGLGVDITELLGGL